MNRAAAIPVAVLIAAAAAWPAAAQDCGCGDRQGGPADLVVPRTVYLPQTRYVRRVVYVPRTRYLRRTRIVPETVLVPHTDEVAWPAGYGPVPRPVLAAPAGHGFSATWQSPYGGGTSYGPLGVGLNYDGVRDD